MPAAFPGKPTESPAGTASNWIRILLEVAGGNRMSYLPVPCRHERQVERVAIKRERGV